MNQYLRMLIIDDDTIFGSMLKKAAEQRGYDVFYAPSLMDMGSFAKIRDFDVVVTDYFLDALRGDEIAQYADVFFEGGIPIVMVSAHDFDVMVREKWPQAVKSFVPKSKGISAILDTVAAVYDRECYLNTYRQKPVTPPNPIGVAGG